MLSYCSFCIFKLLMNVVECNNSVSCTFLNSLSLHIQLFLLSLNYRQKPAKALIRLPACFTELRHVELPSQTKDAA